MRSRLTAALPFLLILATSCASSHISPGSYRLVSVDGASLPRAFDDDSCSPITAGSLEVRGDATWHGALSSGGRCGTGVTSDSYAGHVATLGRKQVLVLDSTQGHRWTDTLDLEVHAGNVAVRYRGWDAGGRRVPVLFTFRRP